MRQSELLFLCIVMILECDLHELKEAKGNRIIDLEACLAMKMIVKEGNLLLSSPKRLASPSTT